jgi:hypothetical protein
MKKKFIQFLKDNNALIPFITELALQTKGVTLSEYYNYIMKKYDARRLILLSKNTSKQYGLRWDETDEGADYWPTIWYRWNHSLK